MTPGRALGFADPAYAAALRSWGDPQVLPRSGGGIVVRSTPGRGGLDAIGTYPIFDCIDWSLLPDDVEALRGQLVSLVVVTDAFATQAVDVLRRSQADVCRPYKDHYVVDLRLPISTIGRRSRRRTAQKALSMLELAAVPGEQADVGEWVDLYAHVARLRKLTGIRAFSPESFSMQFSMAGAEFLTARVEGTLVAAQLCLRRGDVVYSHLGASSPVGYRMRAMHGLDLFALDYFHGSAAWFDFGGGNGGPNDGLAAYKQSWATSTLPTYLAGWVLDPDAYGAEVLSSGNEGAEFFPAYRASTSF